VSLTAQDNDGGQPIHCACDNGYVELVKWLAQQYGVSLTAEDNDGWQPIHCASMNGHLELVKWLAQQHGVSLTAEDNDGWQPIHCASCKGPLELVKWLSVQHGVSLTAEDNDGWQPMHYACGNGHLEVVKWLAVQDGVSLAAYNKDGRPPIHCAWESGHLEVVEWLLGQELSSSDDAVEGNADICLEPEEFDSGDDETASDAGPILRWPPAHAWKISAWAHLEDICTAHTGLVALPEELRASAGRVRELKVRSNELDDWRENERERMSGERQRVCERERERRGERERKRERQRAHERECEKDDDDDDAKQIYMRSLWELIYTPASLTAENIYGCQPIHSACGRGHLELVKWLAAKDGVSLTAKTKKSGSQPIHLACGNGHLKLVKWLAQQHGVSLTAKTKKGSQPIHVACGKGQLELVKWLAQQHGVSLTAEDTAGWQPMHWSCCNGHLEVVKWLLGQDGVSLDITIPDDGRTPLHLAAEEDHVDVVSLLLEAKAAVDSFEINHRTPLIDACFVGRKGAASVLIKAGANINARTIGGKTALHRAAASGNASLVAFLLEHRADVNARDGSEWTPLYSYVVNYKPDGVDHTHVGVVSELLKARADVNIRAKAFEKRVSTPLHVAARRGRPEMVSALLSACDADPDVRDTFQQTPLHTTSSSECAQFLLTFNANPDALDQQNWAPLHVAAKWGNLEVMAVLLQHANINLKDSKGRTALHLASQNAQESAVSALVDAGADIHARNKRQEAPLHSVSNTWQTDERAPKPCGPYERQRCAEILLKARADPDAANCDGECPLHFAVKYVHPEVAKVLLEYGAATHHRNRNRQTPLDLCEQAVVENAQSGDSDLFQELLNILKQAAKDRPAGFSTKLLQKHEQSPQGAFSPMLEVVLGLTSDAAHSTSSKASAASTRTARSMASALVGAKSDDARSVTSSSSKASAASTDARSVPSSRSMASAASTRSAASSGPFIPKKDCRFWLNGFCRFGQNCTFKHDSQKKGSGLGGKQGDSPGTGVRTGARFGPPVVSASTPPGPDARQKGSGSAPRAQGATATKNPFGMLEEQEDDE
jgi:ankyrin repeat protein